MRRLLLLLALAAPLPAGDADPAAPQIPVSTTLLVRHAPLDRFDAFFARFAFLFELFDRPVPSVKDLEANALPPGIAVDRSKPLYVAVGDSSIWGFPLAMAATMAQRVPLEQSRVAVRRGDMVWVGETGVVDGEWRGAPPALLQGDLAFHLFLAEALRNGRGIPERLAARLVEAVGEDAPAPLSRLARGGGDLVKEILLGLESLDYAGTLHEERLDVEGRIAWREGSGARALLERLGAPGENALAGWLPADALLTVDSCHALQRLGEELAAWCDRFLGEGRGKALMQLFGPTTAFAGLLAGRSAIATRLEGISVSTSGIWEVTEGADMDAALRAFDPAEVNRSLEELGIPFRIAFRKAGEGDEGLHRIGVTSELPELLMVVAFLQGCLKVEGRHLLFTQSSDPASEMKALLERLRAGPPATTPHLAAMARLGATRSLGFTLDLGRLKTLLPIAAAASPDAAIALKALPDRCALSTAAVAREGTLHWKGDWPLAGLDSFVRTVREEE
ncbi:MAG: hypothetical protein ACT4PV_13715 [Planctomycetaceae bacterium]